MSNIQATANQNSAGLTIYTQQRQSRVEHSRPQQAIGEDGAGSGPKEAAPRIQGKSVFARLQLANDIGNRKAATLRSNDDRLATIAKLVMGMKHAAMQIVKNYPPFLTGDPERIKLLRSMNGLRKQIDNLTLPPDEKWYGKIPGELPEMVADAFVQAAASSLDSAAEAIALQRSDQSGPGYGNEMKMAELQAQSPEGLVLNVPSEADAYQKSAEVSASLWQQQAGMAGDNAELLQAVG